MGLASFRIRASAGEPLAVALNGQQLPDGLHVLGYDLRMVDGIPQLALFVSGESSIEGEGLVVVQRESNEDYGAELRRIVEGLDEDEWGRRAIEAAPSLDSSPAGGFKTALLEMLPGGER